MEYKNMISKILSSTMNRLSLIVAGFCAVLGTSYAVFMINTEEYKAAEMYVGNLLYSMNLNVIENQTAVTANTVTIPSDYTYTVMVDISSLNPVRSKYKLQYSTACTECLVFISDVSGWNYTGYLNAQGVDIDSKTIKVIIINPTNTSATINFAVTGGYAYNSNESIAKTEGYKEDFKDYYVDSSSSKIITQIVKDDTECVPTSSEPCYYGGEEKRNYITNNEKIYRMLGVYLIDNVEYVKMIDLTNTSSTSYNDLLSSSSTYYGELSNTKTNYSTTSVSALTSDEYIKIGGKDSYINTGETILTSTTSGDNAFYINDNGEILTVGKSYSKLFKPVLVLKTDARVKNNGKGTIDDPYVIADSLSDIIISDIIVDGAHTQTTPTTGVYTMTSSCTGGTVTWKDRNYTVGFEITEPPLICSLNFVHSDIKFNIKVNGSTAAIPKTGNYSMDYNCGIGSATLSWDNANYNIYIDMVEGPILCDVNFTSI